MTAAIHVNELRKRYGETVAVDGLSFSVESGEIFGLIGPNGSGKTTTVECVQGLRERDGGEVSVLGLDPASQRPALGPRIGCQLQEAALPDRIKVWEALDLFASLAQRPADWQELLEQWGLSKKRDASFANLSGGQRQRLFVALAFVNQPEIVFLDEMTTGLDPSARREAWRLIEEIRKRGTTVVLVTHFMDEAERLCDRVGVVLAGRLVALDTPARLAQAHGGQTRVLFGCADNDLGWLERVEGVSAIYRRGTKVEVNGSGPVLVHVAAGLAARGIVPPDLRVEQPSLEDAFLALTERGGET
ncbi:MAG: ABC transporter ATP-binding protein [Gaiellaceae bacterium]